MLEALLVWLLWLTLSWADDSGRGAKTPLLHILAISQSFQVGLEWYQKQIWNPHNEAPGRKKLRDSKQSRKVKIFLRRKNFQLFGQFSKLLRFFVYMVPYFMELTFVFDTTLIRLEMTEIWPKFVGQAFFPSPSPLQSQLVKGYCYCSRSQTGTVHKNYE